MILLVGKSASGKSTVLNFLSKMGYKRVVSVTTRPPREGEIQGKDYHFVDDKTFSENVALGLFLETTSYKVATGETWRYGTLKKSYNDDSVVIVNPDGLKKVKEVFKDKAISFLLDCSNKTILERQKARGDNPEEAFRRFIADMEDFNDIDKYIDFSLSSDLLSPEQLAFLIDEINKEVESNV